MRPPKPRSQSCCHPCIIWMWIFPQWNTAKDSAVHKSAEWDPFKENGSEPGWLWGKGWRLTIAENTVHHHPPLMEEQKKPVVTSENHKRWFSTRKTEESLNEYNQDLNYHWKRDFFLQKKWLWSSDEEVTLIHINHNIIILSINLFLEWHQDTNTNLQHRNLNCTLQHVMPVEISPVI